MRDRIHKPQAWGALGHGVDACSQSRGLQGEMKREVGRMGEGGDQREKPQADARNAKIKESLD